MNIQFLIPLVEGREQWHKKLMASIPRGSNVLALKAHPVVADSRKELLDRSTGDYVAMLDDDDELDTANIPALISYLAKEKPECVMTSSTKIDFYSKRLVMLNDLTGVDYSNFLTKGTFPHQLIICKREFALKAWKAANRYITSLYKTFDASKEEPGLDPRGSFDPAFCWEVLMTGKVQFYEPNCYLWRLHTREQLHVTGTKSHFKVVSYYREKYKKKFLNDFTA